MKPENCPQCKQPLYIIIPVEEGVRLEWDAEKGYYATDDAQQIISFLCAKCNQKIGWHRADGEHWGIIPETE